MPTLFVIGFGIGVSTCLLGSGCIVHSSSPAIPAPTPAIFLDAKSSVIIHRVLVIPRYDSSTGLSTVIGEGPGSMHYQHWLDDPFLYEDGRVFTLRDSNNSGLMIGPGLMWIGTSKHIEKVYVVATGYRGAWVTLVSEKTVTGKLDPISPTESQAQINGLRTALLQLKHLDDCEVRFDASDTNLVASYLDK